MYDSKLPEGMTESPFFASDDKILKFPNVRLDIWNMVVLRLFWTILDLHKSNFFLEKVI